MTDVPVSTNNKMNERQIAFTDWIDDIDTAAFCTYTRHQKKHISDELIRFVSIYRDFRILNNRTHLCDCVVSKK